MAEVIRIAIGDCKYARYHSAVIQRIQPEPVTPVVQPRCLPYSRDVEEAGIVYLLL